jgi:hypothetical protein
MIIRKTYKGINPNLLYDEIKELVRRQELTLGFNKQETYSMPTDSSTFIYRGTLTFLFNDNETLRAHIIGTDKGETKLIIDSKDELFSKDKVENLENDLNFLLGSYEAKT